MTPAEFVQLAKNEHRDFVEMCFDPSPKTAVACQLAAIKLNENQMIALKQVIDGLLTDVFYTWLLALDGCAQIGGRQEAYILKDEEGNLLTDGGTIEAAAYEAFHGKLTKSTSDDPTNL